uniref:histidine phosphatase family protein n=1 Tax=Pararhizobium sp. IMCC3301 TaxID=3067904 RepID=UPI0027412ECF|nr:histidine phosphatase family protein [Pararhizobium sp. IMCC3301]
MPDLLRYLSHPQVRIDPAVAVPHWGLSDLGRTRAERASRSEALADTTRIFSSSERKAVETADIFAAALRLPVEQKPATHENDRSATGFLDAALFEATADRFFQYPDTSIDGWERAIDAQSRIVAAIEDIIHEHSSGDILVVGHGAVGTLLYCHFAGIPISRSHDQPPGGGHFFTIDLASRKPLHPWRPMEQL